MVPIFSLSCLVTVVGKSPYERHANERYCESYIVWLFQACNQAPQILQASRLTQFQVQGVDQSLNSS